MNTNYRFLWFMVCCLLLALCGCVDGNKSDADDGANQAKEKESSRVTDPFSPKSLAGPMSHEDSLFVADIPDKPWTDYRKVGTVDGKVVMLQVRNYLEDYALVDGVSIDYPQWRLVTLQDGKPVDMCYYRGYDLDRNVKIMNDRVVILLEERPYEYEVTDMPRYIDAYANRFGEDFTTDSICAPSATFLIKHHPAKEQKLLAQTIAWLYQFMPYAEKIKDVKSISTVKDFCEAVEPYFIEDGGETVTIIVVPIWQSADRRFETYSLYYAFRYAAAGPHYSIESRYLTLDNQEGIMLGYKDVLNEDGKQRYAGKIKGPDEAIPEVALMPNGLYVMGDMLEPGSALKLVNDTYKAVLKPTAEK